MPAQARSRTERTVRAGGAVALVNSGKDDTKNTMGTHEITPSKDNSTKSSDSANSTPEATNTVSIKDFLYSPVAIKVKVGDTVTWTNNDSTSHTITADTASDNAPNSSTITKGGTYSFTFKTAGTYAYHCNFHGQMKGTVEVTE